jgi:hypothetical protein
VEKSREQREREGKRKRIKKSSFLGHQWPSLSLSRTNSVRSVCLCVFGLFFKTLKNP